MSEHRGPMGIFEGYGEYDPRYSETVEEVICPSGCAWCDEPATACKLPGDYPQWVISCDHAGGCPVMAVPGPNSSVMMRYEWTTARKAINDWEARGPS